MTTNNEDLQAQAQQLYVSYYGRPADPAGLEYWVKKFGESDNADEVIEDFGNSDEYLDWIDSNGLDTSEDLVNALYQQMFNRDADLEGLAFYVDLLESGVLTLASIALDIANGASDDDRIILDNKVEVANTYTEEVEETESLYTSNDILAASAIIAAVDDTDASVEVGNSASVAVVGDLPKIMKGGEYNLDEDTAVANYSGATAAVQVTLDGRDDEADFDVKGSAFDDLFIVEEFRSANLDGNDGIDTLDLSDLNGTGDASQVTVTLLGGTFSYNTVDASFLGTISGFENVIGTDGDDIISGDIHDNTIWGGEGNDTLSGGIGDDTFVFEDETDLSNSVITGGIGTDTLELTGATLDGSTLNAVVDVEALILSNLDEEDEVTIRMTSGQIANFETITGSSVKDTLSTDDGNLDLSDTVISDIEVLDKITAAGDITISEGSFAGAIQIVGHHDLDTDRLLSSGNEGDVIDVSMLTLNHIKTIELQGVGETLIISQSQVDALLAINNDEIFGSSSDEDDSLEFSSSIDLSGVDGEDIYFGSINYGAADSVTFTDLADAEELFTVIGTSLNNVLAIEDTDEEEKLIGVKLVDIEHLVIDPDDDGTNVIIDEITLGSINILEGDFTLTAMNNDFTGEEYINLIGMTFDGDILLASDIFDGNMENDSFLINQEVIDSIAGTGGHAGANLVTLGDIDMSSEDLTLTPGTTVIAAIAGTTITAASAILQVYILLEGGTVIPTNGGTTGFEGNIVIGSDNSDTITASYVKDGGSNDHLTGGGGSDIFNVSMKAVGLTLADFNTGTARDTLNLEVGAGTPTVAGTRTFLTLFTDVPTSEGGSDTADPFTASGGLRFLNGNSSLVNAALGSALGNTVALPEVTGNFSGITSSVTGGGAFVTSTTIDATITSALIEAVTTGITVNSLVNTTFVRFYVIEDITSKKQVSASVTQTNTFNQLYAVIVGAGGASSQTNAITRGEVSVTLLATLGESTLSGADIVLV